MYLDTNILIYLLEMHPAYSELVASALEESVTAGNKLVTSVITITEFLAGTTSSSLEMLHRIPRLEFVTLNENVAEQAALLQRNQKIQIGDAIHLATALDVQAKIFFSNDLKLTKVVERHILVKRP